MKFPDEFLAELKTRIRLSDFIGKSVKLRRSGREYAGLSPFTKERTPSFYVNDDKGFYHCFSSGKHGDAIDFLMETERLSFPEAVERLASEAGIPVPKTDPKSVAEARRKQGLIDWVTLAARWFEAELWRPSHDVPQVYLSHRGLDGQVLKQFGLGYAPASRTALKDYLVAKGAHPRELVEAGLLIAPEDGTAPYDRFRHRIIFPIRDPLGRVISFGGRALDPEARAKYLNGPDTPLFDKGRVLYGLSDARKLLANDPGAPLVVVEGYMDVIACQRALIPAVAPMGTALTEGQMELLWRVHPEPTLCFDGDVAGLRAAGRVIERALPMLRPGRSMRFAMVEGGKDPDDILRDHGADELRAQIDKTRSLADTLFDREMAATDMLSPDARAMLRTKLKEAARLIPNRDLGAEYEAHFRDRFQSALGRGERTAPVAAVQNCDLPPVAGALVKALLDDPERAEGVIEREVSLGHPGLDAAYRAVIEHMMAGGEATLMAHLLSRGLGGVLEEVTSAPDTYVDRDLWLKTIGLIADYTALETALQAAKANMKTAADVAAFSALKTQRDAAKKAMPR